MSAIVVTVGRIVAAFAGGGPLLGYALVYPDGSIAVHLIGDRAERRGRVRLPEGFGRRARSMATGSAC